MAKKETSRRMRNNLTSAEIEGKLEEMDRMGYCPKTVVSVLREVGPSIMNAGENGEQKHIHMGNTDRMMYSAASRKSVVRRSQFPGIEMLQSKVPHKTITSLFEQRKPGYDKKFYDEIEKFIKNSFFSEGTPSYLLFREDLEAIYDSVNRILDAIKDPITTSAGKKQAEELLKAEVEIVGTLNAAGAKHGAFFSDFSTDKKMQSYRGGLYVAHSISVTPYYAEQNYTSKMEYYNYYKELRRLEDQDDDNSASIGTFVRDCNSGIMLEQHALNARTSLRVLMGVLGDTVETAWDKSLEYYNRMNSELYDRFIQSVPVGGQTTNYTHTLPFCVLVRITTGEPISVEDIYSDAIRNESHAEEIAAKRLVAYAKRRNFESPRARTKRFVLLNEELEGIVPIPDSAKYVTHAEMCDLLAAGFVVTDEDR